MTTTTTEGIPEVVTLGPLYGRYKRWHEAPALPSTEGDPAAATALAGAALVLRFEAAAKEDLRVGFARRDVPTWQYEVALGSSGNTEVVVRKALGSRELELAKVFAGRTLSGHEQPQQSSSSSAPASYVPYWVVIHNDTLVAGIGADVGKEIVAKCLDPKAASTTGAVATASTPIQAGDEENGEQQQPPPPPPSGDQVPDAGFLPMQRVAFTTWNQGALIRNIRLELAPREAVPSLAEWQPRVIVRAAPLGQEDLLTEEQRDNYQRECETIRRRAERFGGAFVAPDLKKFLDPKVIRRLQRTGAAAAERGFTTGIDMLSQEETQRREARMRRFDTPKFAVEYSTEAVRALSEGMTQEEWSAREAERAKLRERAIKFGLDPDANPKSSNKAGDLGLMNLRPASKKVRAERCDVPASSPEYRDDAIHVYSLDERFQQVRTNDIMEYFSGYGPWYVEWINDSACTVVFEDPHTAGRALIALAAEIPLQVVRQRASSQQAEASMETTETTETTETAPAPADGDGDVDMDDGEATTATPGGNATTEEVPDEPFNRSQWRYGQAIRSATQPSSKKWRLLLRRATSEDFPPEKTNKRYHERRAQPPEKRGRGHRSGNQRSHPYRRR